MYYQDIGSNVLNAVPCPASATTIMRVGLHDWSPCTHEFATRKAIWAQRLVCRRFHEALRK